MARRQTLSGVTRVNNARLIGGYGTRRLRRLSALLRPGQQRIRDRGKPDYKRLSYFASAGPPSLQIAVPYSALARFISDPAAAWTNKTWRYVLLLRKKKNPSAKAPQVPFLILCQVYIPKMFNQTSFHESYRQRKRCHASSEFFLCYEDWKLLLMSINEKPTCICFCRNMNLAWTSGKDTLCSCNIKAIDCVKRLHAIEWQLSRR